MRDLHVNHVNLLKSPLLLNYRPQTTAKKTHSEGLLSYVTGLDVRAAPFADPPNRLIELPPDALSFGSSHRLDTTSRLEAG